MNTDALAERFARGGSIEILGRAWTLTRPKVVFNTTTKKEDTELFGFTDAESMNIQIADNLLPEKFREILFHEIHHSVLNDLGLNHPERLVQGGTPVLLDVLRRNDLDFR